jgi:MscS family membrane protein
VPSSFVIAVAVAQSVPAGASEALPRALRTLGPQGLAWWQWLALPVLIAGSLLAGRILGAIMRGVLMRVARRTTSSWDERWLARIGPALTAVWATAVAAAALPWLDLPPAAWRFATAVLTAAGVVAIFWMLWRSVDTLIEMVLERSWAAGDPSARSLLLVGGNLLKAAVVVMGAITTAATFGYPVTTVVAGLGIGGIAFAFGAQKTVEHLFGSIALATDQPCRVGDTVKVDDVVGQVEYIGTRSTRIRTPDRTVVTIPNGRLADSRIESYAARDRMRLATTITLGYGATEAQVRQAVAGIERVLHAHPLVWPDVAVARLGALGPTTIDIEILCWFETTDYETYRAARQDVLFGVMRVVEASGASFAQLPPAAPPVAPAPPVPLA